MPKFLEKEEINLRISFSDDDDIIESIKKDGFLDCPELFRRWVMAQMFRMLRYKTKDWGPLEGYNEYLNNELPYLYQFHVMQDECKYLAKLERAGLKDSEEYKIRSSFFKIGVIQLVCWEALEKLEKKTGRHLSEMAYCLNKVSSYADLEYFLYKEFPLDAIKKYIPKNTLKSGVWKNAYKGAGSYYTLANLICSHGCWVENEETGEKLYDETALKYLNKRFERCKATGEWWQLFGWMKDVITYNQLLDEKLF